MKNSKNRVIELNSIRREWIIFFLRYQAEKFHEWFGNSLGCYTGETSNFSQNGVIWMWYMNSFSSNIFSFEHCRSRFPHYLKFKVNAVIKIVNARNISVTLQSLIIRLCFSDDVNCGRVIKQYDSHIDSWDRLKYSYICRINVVCLYL